LHVGLLGHEEFHGTSFLGLHTIIIMQRQQQQHTGSNGGDGCVPSVALGLTNLRLPLYPLHHPLGEVGGHLRLRGLERGPEFVVSFSFHIPSV
jgi:hypothetical protein